MKFVILSSVMAVFCMTGCGQQQKKMIQEQAEEIASLKSELIAMRLESMTDKEALRRESGKVAKLERQQQDKLDAVVDKLVELEKLDAETVKADNKIDAYIRLIERELEDQKRRYSDAILRLNEIEDTVKETDPFMVSIEYFVEEYERQKDENRRMAERIEELEKTNSR